MKKIVILLIIYFAGFATAIYFLTPASAQGHTKNISGSKKTVSSFNSQKFSKGLNTNVNKCIKYAKDTSNKAVCAAKKKLQERRQRG